LARLLADRIDKAGILTKVFKMISFPLLLLIARADTLSANISRHQGFLFEVVRLK